MSFFVAAYLVLWVGIFAYLLWIGARLQRVREETRLLERESRRDHSAETATPSGSGDLS